jgi:hypothetical protein
MCLESLLDILRVSDLDELPVIYFYDVDVFPGFMWYIRDVFQRFEYSELEDVRD